MTGRPSIPGHLAVVDKDGMDLAAWHVTLSDNDDVSIPRLYVMLCCRTIWDEGGKHVLKFQFWGVGLRLLSEQETSV